jgi:hypothetical protein
MSEIPGMPVPKTIVQADPGGVNCTTRMVSLIWLSTPSSNPACW